MSTSVSVIVIGLVIIFISFVFAAVNMFRGVTGRTSSGIDGLFKGHLGAMVGILAGGMVTFIGIVMLVIDLVG